MQKKGFLEAKFLFTIIFLFALAFVVIFEGFNLIDTLVVQDESTISLTSKVYFEKGELEYLLLQKLSFYGYCGDYSADPCCGVTCNDCEHCEDGTCVNECSSGQTCGYYASCCEVGGQPTCSALCTDEPICESECSSNEECCDGEFCGGICCADGETCCNGSCCAGACAPERYCDSIGGWAACLETSYDVCEPNHECSGTPPHLECSDCENIDCFGVCDGGAVEDCLGVCDGGAVEDCLGVCDGGAVVDCLGVCDGGAVVDCLGVCGGSADFDCLGVCDGGAIVDVCGTCNGGITDPALCSCPSGYFDCLGVCDGSAVVDCLGVCDGGAVEDCLGDCGGSADFDCLGVCDGGAVVDCLGVCNGGADFDCAGVCNGSSEWDCLGVCNGSTYFDVCGVCGGSETNPDNCDDDCPSQNFDCEGVCDGGAEFDCAGVCNGSSGFDCAGVCNGSSGFDCLGVCGGSAVVDCLGVCNGSAYFCNGVCCTGDCGFSRDCLDESCKISYELTCNPINNCNSNLDCGGEIDPNPNCPEGQYLCGVNCCSSNLICGFPRICFGGDCVVSSNLTCNPLNSCNNGSECESGIVTCPEIKIEIGNVEVIGDELYFDLKYLCDSGSHKIDIKMFLEGVEIDVDIPQGNCSDEWDSSRIGPIGEGTYEITCGVPGCQSISNFKYISEKGVSDINIPDLPLPIVVLIAIFMILFLTRVNSREKLK